MSFGDIMSIKIQIPTPMREQTGGKAEVEVSGTTVKAALDDLLRQFPGVGPKLFDNGKLRPYVNVFVNDEDIRYLDEMDTAITDGVIVALIPAVAGG
jgi:molybdopterin converting factor small subunit